MRNQEISGGFVSFYYHTDIVYAGNNQWQVYTVTIPMTFMRLPPLVSESTSYDAGLTWTPARKFLPTTGSWYNGYYSNVHFCGANGNTVAVWPTSDVTLDGNNTGSDTDIFYMVREFSGPPTAARDWALFE